MRVRALQKIYYERSDRHPGDVYDMDDREEAEAKILALLGKIEIVEPPAREAEREVLAYQTRNMTAQPEQPQPQSESTAVAPMTTTDATTPNQRYHRRDMRPKK